LVKYQNQLEKTVRERTLLLQQSLEREQQLSQTERDLRQTLELKMRQRVDFYRMLVHELKTPLMPLLGTSSLLLDEIKDEPYHSMVQNINHGAVSLSERIEELLDLEKAEAGLLNIELVELDLMPLLRQVFDTAAHQASKQEQRLSLDLPDSLPHVRGDAVRIQQILLNLLVNAFSNTPYASDIVLRARAGMDCVIVEVQDDGPGIPEEKRQGLFKSYYHLDQNKDHQGGLGIGLALCRRLIDLQHGKIWLDSNFTKGALFAFSLPTIK
jgi:signal transduction histidine kinase